MKTVKEEIALRTMKDNSSDNDRIGPEVTRNVKLEDLIEVEEYIRVKQESLDFDIRYDISAFEIPYFKTVTYSEVTFGLFLRPLNPEVAQLSIEFAIEENLNTIDYVSFLQENIKTKQCNKYEELNNQTGQNVKITNLVLPSADNLFKDFVCQQKIELALDTDNAYIKPHPISSYSLEGHMKDRFSPKKVIDKFTNVFNLMENSETIFVSSSSELSMYAIALGKEIEPIDLYHKKDTLIMNHINHHLWYLTPDLRKERLNNIASSALSGVIIPSIQSDWKLRIDKYFEFISEFRETFERKYI